MVARSVGHADTRMTEKHYARLSPNYVAETVLAALPLLGIADKSNVTALTRRTGRHTERVG
jgi:hypothetical protein